jgi:hypothetical protein
MLANDMKKGQMGTQVNGWKFEIADNLKGVTRMAKVWGLYTEIGNIYIHNIASLDMPDGSTEKIEFSPAQVKQIGRIKLAGF